VEIRSLTRKVQNVCVPSADAQWRDGLPVKRAILYPHVTKGAQWVRNYMKRPLRKGAQLRNGT
jgi:hypothetical protein